MSRVDDTQQLMARLITTTSHVPLLNNDDITHLLKQPPLPTILTTDMVIETLMESSAREQGDICIYRIAYMLLRMSSLCYADGTPLSMLYVLLISQMWAATGESAPASAITITDLQLAVEELRTLSLVESIRCEDTDGIKCGWISRIHMHRDIQWVVCQKWVTPELAMAVGSGLHTIAILEAGEPDVCIARRRLMWPVLGAWAMNVRVTVHFVNTWSGLAEGSEMSDVEVTLGEISATHYAYEESEDHFTRVIAILSRLTVANAELATNSYKTHGMTDETQKLVTSALMFHARLMSVYNQTADMYDECGKTDKAQRMRELGAQSDNSIEL